MIDSNNLTKTPETDFLWQNGEAFTVDAKRDWFKARASEAKEAGAVLCRFSVHPDIAGLTLVEAWKVHPSEQGDIRWQLTTIPTTGQAEMVG